MLAWYLKYEGLPLRFWSLGNPCHNQISVATLLLPNAVNGIDSKNDSC